MLADTLFRETADDRLDDVLQGDHSLHDPELVDNEPDMTAGLAELLDKTGSGHGGRDEERRGEDVGKPDASRHGDIRPKRLHRDHAADVVVVALEDRIIGVTGTGDAAPVHVILFIEIEPGDTGARCHQLGRRLFVQIEDTLDHLLLDGVEGTAL